jgi:hypothetical protein
MWSLQRHRRPGDHPCVWAPATPPPLSRPDHTHVPRQTQCHPYCHRAIVPPGVRRSVCCARLLPCLRPPERHTSRPDACVEDRSRHQPGRPYAPATGAGTPHATQRLPHCAVPSVKGRKLRHGKGTLAVAPGRKAIDGQIEARQLVQGSTQFIDLPSDFAITLGATAGTAVVSTCPAIASRNADRKAERCSVDRARLPLSTRTCIKSLRAGPDFHEAKRARWMRTGNLISVIHGSVEISRLDMVAERDPAVIVKAVVSELSHILPLEFLAFPEGLERVVDARQLN